MNGTNGTNGTTDTPAVCKPAPVETHYTRIARASATLELVTPNGYPATITITAATPEEEIDQLLSAAANAAEIAASAGWAAPAAELEPAPAATATAGAEPLFCGHVCSRTYDPASGLPAWILVDGHQAHRHEKQGDQWYSYRNEAGEYARVLTIKRGEAVPGIVWPAGQEPKK